MINTIILFLNLNFNINTGFTFSYYFVPYIPYGDYIWEIRELSVCPKGINLGFSFEKKGFIFRMNPAVIKGGFKSIDYDYYDDYYEKDVEKIDFLEISDEISILSIIPIKELNFYLGPGVFFSFMNYDFEFKEFEDGTMIDYVKIKCHGNLLGFPLITGIEKEIFKKFKIFSEIYLLFHGILKLRGKENGEKMERDYLISNFYPFYFYSEGKMEKMTFGIKYEW